MAAGCTTPLLRKSGAFARQSYPQKECRQATATAVDATTCEATAAVCRVMLNAPCQTQPQSTPVAKAKTSTKKHTSALDPACQSSMSACRRRLTDDSVWHAVNLQCNSIFKVIGGDLCPGYNEHRRVPRASLRRGPMKSRGAAAVSRRPTASPKPTA
jgi:hypothetical protein